MSLENSQDRPSGLFRRQKLYGEVRKRRGVTIKGRIESDGENRSFEELLPTKSESGEKGYGSSKKRGIHLYLLFIISGRKMALPYR